ncbi:ribosome-inactivating family protein (plasmid) [Azospirillum sp. HJ39]|uniref:ribosome-inactivating family protein n=1 Tax=Azospirillum sp. HJ39 TaxID=3159496 RepID=UPI003557B0B0
MLDNVTYPLNVSLIRRDLTNAPPGGGVPGPHQTRTGFGQFTLQFTPIPLTLFYKLDDLYIEGFRARNGKLFLAKNAHCSVVADYRLPYGNEYGELGLDRSSPFKLSLANVNGAITDLYYRIDGKNPNDIKKSFWTICVAFAEAVRFDDVILSILHNKDIDDLDWTHHKKADKVRVVKA